MIIAQRFGRHALGVVAAFGMLAGCGGAQTPALGPTNARLGPATTTAFVYTGGPQTFKVPNGVKSLTITAYGARGGGNPKGSGYQAAPGAKVTATVPVQPGQVLKVYVGGEGAAGAGGFNGGGGAVNANGGGGSSDVRTNAGLANRIVVAAGGGGTGQGFEFMNGTGSYYWCYGGAGGEGGVKTGNSGGIGGCEGRGGGGGGGSQTSGGGGGFGGKPGSGTTTTDSCTGTAGANGKLLDGGAGADTCRGHGGGGGGGYYGGGGGGSGGCCNRYDGSGAGGGGGGGSSFVEHSATHVQQVKGGGKLGNGLVIISW